MKHKPDRQSDRLREWLSERPASRRKRLLKLLRSKSTTVEGITHLLRASELAGLRRELLAELEKE